MRRALKLTVLQLFSGLLLYGVLHKELITASLYLKDNDPSNDAKAVQLLEKLLPEKEKDAAFLLGYYYKTPKYGHLDPTRSQRYYEMAAAWGDKEAKMIVAWNYFKGIGTQKDIEKCKRLLRELAVEGDDNAKEILVYVLSSY